MYATEKYLNVVAQKADPNAVVVKGNRGFSTTIINVMEDGTERPHRIATTLKRDLVKKLDKLPIENVKGMAIETTDGHIRIELFAYTGV